MAKGILMSLGSNMTVLNTTRARVFFSYETPVAGYIPGRGYVKTDRHYSKTTSKHINKYLGGCKAEIVPQSEIDALLEGV